jgi:hypothetical protein
MQQVQTVDVNPRMLDDAKEPNVAKFPAEAGEASAGR